MKTWILLFIGFVLLAGCLQMISPPVINHMNQIPASGGSAPADCPSGYNNVEIFNVSSGLGSDYSKYGGWQMPFNLSINDTNNGSDLVVLENSSGSFNTTGFYRVGTLTGIMSLGTAVWWNWTNGTSSTNSTGTVVINMTKLLAGTNKSAAEFCYNTTNSFTDNSTYLSVFPIVDDFLGSSLNTSKWPTSCAANAPVVSGGTVSFNSGGSYGGSYTLTAKNYGVGYAIVARDYIIFTTATERYSAVGFTDTCGVGGQYAIPAWGYGSSWPGYYTSCGASNCNGGTPTLAGTFAEENNYGTHETSLPTSSVSQELYYANAALHVNYTTSGNIPSNSQGIELGMQGINNEQHFVDWAFVTSDAQPYPTYTSTYATNPQPAINCSFAPYISAISFHPKFNQSNTIYLVYPDGQASPNGTIQCSNEGNTAGTIYAKLNDSYPYVDEVASCDYFGANNLTLNTSNQSLCAISAGSTKNISFYRNYTDKASMTIKNVAVNLSIG